MIEKHAFFFTSAVSALVEFKYLCAELAKIPDQSLTDNTRALAINASHRLRVAYLYSEMGDLLGPLDRFDRSLNPPPGAPPMPASVIGYEVKHLIAGVRDQLEQHFYFHVDQSDVPLYMETEPFGSNVGLKFPDAAEDIAEAAKCLALQRPTASVFHLMRVMELGVKTFGRRLRVTIPDPRNETWHNIVRLVNGKIDALPTKTRAQQARKRDLASAATHLNAVRIATRNEVMHPKQTYTREEAHEVYRATRLFMIDFAGLL